MLCHSTHAADHPCIACFVFGRMVWYVLLPTFAERVHYQDTFCQLASSGHHRTPRWALPQYRNQPSENLCNRHSSWGDACHPGEGRYCRIELGFPTSRLQLPCRVVGLPWIPHVLLTCGLSHSSCLQHIRHDGGGIGRSVIDKWQIDITGFPLQDMPMFATNLSVVPMVFRAVCRCIHVFHELEV